MLKIMLLGTFIHNLAFVLSFANRCPPAEDILPCKCSTHHHDYHGTFETNVFCPNIPSVDELKNAFASLKGTEKLHIKFRDSRFHEIPSDLFSGLDVVLLRFDHGVLERIGEEGRASLEGLENTLRVFSIHDNFDKEEGLEYLNMSSLNVIHTLVIERSKMPTLGNECFKNGPESLRHLTFDTCSIEEIGDEVFEKLVNLKSLTLKRNRLSFISRSMFPSPAPFLEELDLSANGISSLPEDMFSGMPSLTDVDLANNDISSLPEGVFSGMPALKILRLSGNRIAKLTEATWSPIWSKLELLEIMKNPLECDSHIEWMFRYKKPEMLFAQCQTTEYEFKELSLIILKKQKKMSDML